MKLGDYHHSPKLLIYMQHVQMMAHLESLTRRNGNKFYVERLLMV